MESIPTPESSPRRNLFRALAHRDYRLFFLGQSVSQVGTWMQQMSVVWLAYRLTENAFLVGVVGFAAQFPTFLLAPLGGVWSDRFDRRHLLLVTQAIAMIQALVLAALTLTDVVSIESLILLVSVLGAVNGFDTAASQAFVKDLVNNREDLGNAIALNSSITNSARLIGPALAGIVIHLAGEGGCFLINGFSYLAVLIALAAVRPPAEVAAAARARAVWASLREGMTYTFSNGPVRSLLLLVGLLAMFGMPYSLLPVFVKEVLHGGPNELGWLMGAAGLGALLAAVRMAGRRSVVGAESGLVWGGLGLSAALLLLGMGSVLSVSLLCRLSAGFCVLLQMTTANMILQTLIDDEHRGRVSSFYTMSLLGMLPLGNLLSGALAEWVGVSNAFVISGICCLLATARFGWQLPAFRRDTRPVYERMGLMQSPSDGNK